jgi:predicted HTH transcriptional regulator
MPSPRDVFDNPEEYWDFITLSSDDDFEGKQFDRKEVGLVGDNGRISSSQLSSVKDQIQKCISGFANANRTGGLLIVGVSKTGDIKGINHLRENQLNSLTSFSQLLRNQAAMTDFVDCVNSAGNPDRILLIYVPYSETGICETLTTPPEAWLRVGKQNIPLTPQMREQLKRDKRIVDFERTHCCPFRLDEVDRDVLEEFRGVFLADARYDHSDHSDEELLYHAGAIDRDGDGYVFTNAGFLFFAARPQRLMPWAYIRLMRFEVNSDAADARGLYTFDKNFDGPIPQQIRRMRAFFRESGFFKTYQRRNPEGGFIDDPEFPHIAVDEAIVNAVAHRDYGIQLPIECIHYKDAFVVENPGRVLQRDQDLPSEFSLDTTMLSSMPRNSLLIEWLKKMRDRQGAAFVRAISEGTKLMQREMKEASLPAPLYRTNYSRTVVTLFNNAAEREALLRAALAAWTSTQYANLFPLDLLTEEGQKADPETLRNRRRDFMHFLRDALQANGWYIDQFGYGRITAHRRGISLDLPEQVQTFLRFYPAYTMQLREYWGRFYLCIDYKLEVKNVRTVTELLRQVPASELRWRTAVAQLRGWQHGRIVKVDPELTRVYLFDFESEEQIPSNRVMPDLPIDSMRRLLSEAGVRFDLSREMKRHSLALEPGAARARIEKTIATTQQIAESVFPIAMDGLRAVLLTTPEPLYRDAEPTNLAVRTIPEPSVEFKRQKESPNIRDGITSFGAYEDARKEVELVPICTNEMRGFTASLIDRLKAGKYKYSGSERTFSTRLSYSSIITVPRPEEVLAECKRLLDEHPDWAGNEGLDRLFLVHTPESGYSRDDENSPYYQVKRLLLEQGIPCQMVDTPTLLNPDWKDLNLALNIIAKCGVTPWVLPNTIPDADFFIGLSYTQSRKRGRQRLVGYATVFNQFGLWQFYLGNTEAFSYEERTLYFALLTKQTLERLTLSESPNIYFHYSARFSREDREAILQAARSVRPAGTYSFVSINSHHNIRLYDSRAETDGSLSRGSYVVTAPNQILLSTTGYNPFRKSLGTPKPLEVTIRTERPEGMPYPEPDLRSLAVQILSLTKLNWASTDSLCGEPITTKYAGDIAYLTDAFLRQTGTFRLHPVLETTPWFI